MRWLCCMRGAALLTGLCWDEHGRVTACSCKSEALLPNADIQRRAEGYLGGQIRNDMHIHLVRDVAPNKRMFCISFQLPEAIAFPEHADEENEEGDHGCAGEPAMKKSRVD